MLLYLSFVSILIFPKYIVCKGELKKLDESSWKDMTQGEWMVEFFAPWCPACQQLQPSWEEFAKWSDDLGIKVGSVDVTVNPGLSGRFMITALPTIFHVKDGIFRQYRGARDKDSFISFIEEKKWQSIDPVSSWKSPDSYAMSTLSYFFKLSMLLRSLHTTIVEDYGVPYWGSYVLFGIATIIFGTLLGLAIVCILDFVCRKKTSDNKDPSKSAQSENQEKDERNDEFEGDDLIKDEPRDVELRRRKEAVN